MAEAAASFLAENVTQLLKHKKNLTSGAEKELQLLNNDVDLLKAFLQHVRKNPKEEKGELKDMEKQIRDVVYEVEDTIDACLSQKAAANQKNFIRGRLMNKKHAELPKVVKSLRETMVKPTLNRVNVYKSTVAFDDAPTATVKEQPRTSRGKGHVMRKRNVVGLEDEEERIIGYLLEENEGLDVISITGIPGLGKTTLAWKIFHSERIAFCFPLRLWILVSQDFNKRNAMLFILSHFTSQDISSMSDEELSETVVACLQGEKFLLVFDDVWGLGDWPARQEFLPKSNGKGKVLITTQLRHISAHGKTHKLRLLSEEESWTLLQLEVFGNLEDCPRELEAIGRLIARKCGGLPLLVEVLAGILVSHPTMSGWEQVSENVDLFWHTERSISRVMELTYSELPEELRVCLLYMGVFPEYYEISTWTLTRLWIAEGFVQPKGGKSLEESAYQNLDDLVSRNLVIASRINPRGEVKMCRVHDVIRAFFMHKAQEENLFRVIRSWEGVAEHPVSELQEARRLCVYSAANTLLAQLPKTQGVRSFLCFAESPIHAAEPSLSQSSAIPNAFHLLRVLELRAIKLDGSIQEMMGLFHLRYITLSVDDLKSLPETLSELWNLQTLLLHTNSSNVIVMKANIWRLIRLRHLKTNAAIVLSPDMKGGDAGENLQTLNRVSPDSCTEAVCARARGLKTLGIRGKLATIYQNSCLGKLNSLDKLKLINDLSYEERGLQADFPQHNFFPPNLKRLTLSNTSFEWKHMSILATLSNLQVLKLKDRAFLGAYWRASDDCCFPNLELLIISNTDIVLWEASASSFPKLSCLRLRNCENLIEIPQALAKTLEELDVDHLRKSAAESARMIADGKRKAEAAWKVPKFKLIVGPSC